AAANSTTSSNNLNMADLSALLASAYGGQSSQYDQYGIGSQGVQGFSNRGFATGGPVSRGTMPRFSGFTGGGHPKADDKVIAVSGHEYVLSAEQLARAGGPSA